jgi:hypothetical protein
VLLASGHETRLPHAAPALPLSHPVSILYSLGNGLHEIPSADMHLCESQPQLLALLELARLELVLLAVVWMK